MPSQRNMKKKKVKKLSKKLKGKEYIYERELAKNLSGGENIHGLDVDKIYYKDYFGEFHEIKQIYHSQGTLYEFVSGKWKMVYRT